MNRKTQSILPVLESRDGAIIDKSGQVLIAAAAGRCHQPMVVSARAKEQAAELARRSNAYPQLVASVQQLLKAHEALMPGLRHIAVQDYALQNEAPLNANKLLRELGETA